jgi:hydrogenase maturation protease
MKNRQSKILIIGVGNLYRRDDGVGLQIAAQLQATSANHLSVMESSGEGASLMEGWKAAESVIVIDAVRSGAKAGTIHRLDAQKEKMPAAFFNYSTHAFSLAEAVELARTLRRLPRRLVVYGIEGENFQAGIGLSAAVENAARKVQAMILNEIEQMQAASRD